MVKNILLVSIISLTFFGAIFVAYKAYKQLPTQPSVLVQASSPLPSITPSVVETATLYQLINGLRTQESLVPLRIHPALEKSAQLKLLDMIKNEYWQHQDKTQVESWYLFNQAGYDYQLAGENLAFGLNTSWKVFDGWLQSERHRQEMLTPDYQDMGLAVDCSTYDNGCIVVLHLGKN